jgi:hypothetical protein
MMINKNFFILLLVLALCLVGCGSGESGSDINDNICGQEPCYEGPFEAPWLSAFDYGLEFWAANGVRLNNDNKVLETDNLLIYSDASEDWAKIEMGQTGESALALIMGLFQVTLEEIGIVDLYSRIEVYSMRRINSIGNRADYNGFTCWSHDTYNTAVDPSWVLETAEHECTHTVQFRLGGTYSVVWCWFTEGVAEAVSGDGGVFPPIRCWEEVVEFRNQPGSVNPITIRYLEDIPDYETIPGQRSSEYYPMFGLAVSYLLSPEGHGKTYIDVKYLFRDIAAGMDFPSAFHKHMGISQDYFRDHFYELMEQFLPASCD